MTHDEILVCVDRPCIVMAELIRMASQDMLDEMRRWIPHIGKRHISEGRRGTVTHLPFGSLHARESNDPGMVMWLKLARGISYGQSTLWLSATRLPDSILLMLPGRRAGEVVDMHHETPTTLCEAIIREARHTGNRLGGPESTNVRMDLEVTGWIAP